MKNIFGIISLIYLLAFSNNLYAVKVVNFKQNFEKFWSEAKGKDFKEQEKSWVKNIESVDPVFYEVNVWGKNYNPSWKENREKTLRRLFSMYSKMNINDYLKTYSEYEETVSVVLNDYKKQIPEYKANIIIMIAPGITWGGSYSRNSENKKEYLALGVDQHFKMKSEGKKLPIEPLIIHEMFHHYFTLLRGDKVDISFDNYLKNGKLFWQLWDEGMAVWGTEYVGKTSDIAFVLLGANGTYNPEKNSYYAKMFLKELDNPAIDLENPINVKKWFGSHEKDNPLGKGTPPMIGYYLGWYVIKGIRKDGIKPEEFLSWSYEEARPHIIKQLKKMSVNK